MYCDNTSMTRNPGGNVNTEMRIFDKGIECVILFDTRFFLFRGSHCMLSAQFLGSDVSI